ncbi:MAG: ABC transporter ATP-binding protein [Chloroflexi bacterium]|nr:ABC transporter ATP-binding protein [Chloroflexota bacterium]
MSLSGESRGAEIRLESLTKRFGNTVAVDQITLDIQGGEFLTLLGPSGSGKTTTLRLIAGFELPTAGDILMDGASIVAVPPYRRNIGMVFQNYALFPHMTVFGNIAFPLEMRRVDKTKIAEEVARVLELVQLPGFEGRYPRQLSGGQQQRIALARALVFNPRVLLMDEPLGSLDRKLREHMQLEIKHIQERLHITVIYVTHDQEEALVMSDRIAVINQGRIEQVGTPQELYERPQSRFVADFIGETNLLQGEVVELGTAYSAVRVENSVIVRVAAREGLAVGQRVTLAIRPAMIRFLAPGEALANTYTGVIEEVIYIGEITKYRVGLSKELCLIVKQAGRFDPKGRGRGTPVTIGWDLVDAKVV